MDHFGFQIDDLVKRRKKIGAAGGKRFFELDDRGMDNFERKFADPDGVEFDNSEDGWVGTDGRTSRPSKQH